MSRSNLNKEGGGALVHINEYHTYVADTYTTSVLRGQRSKSLFYIGRGGGVVVCFACVCEIDEVQREITARRGRRALLGSIDWRTF